MIWFMAADFLTSSPFFWGLFGPFFCLKNNLGLEGILEPLAIMYERRHAQRVRVRAAHAWSLVHNRN